jgi:hypothetical protein
MHAPDYTEMNSQEPNPQAARILAANAIPWSPQTDLASLALIRHVLEAGELRTPTISEPLLLVAKLHARPQEAMRLLTESDLGEPFATPLDLDDSPTEAAAQLLEEIVASLQAQSPTPLLL